MPINSQCLNASQVFTVAHKLKYLYILGNNELTNFIFDKKSQNVLSIVPYF